MLHLAQVQKQGFLGKAGLRLLARQKSEHTWVLIAEEDVILSTEASTLGEGLLVLVELSSTRQVLSIREARDWILELIQIYLTTGITPTFLQQETERAEQWRQSLTLQSQELDRRALEVEARREQIQVLEKNIKQEKQQLDAIAAQHLLHSQELDHRAQALDALQKELDAQADALKRREEKLLEASSAQTPNSAS